MCHLGSMTGMASAGTPAIDRRLRIVCANRILVCPRSRRRWGQGNHAASELGTPYGYGYGQRTCPLRPTRRGDGGFAFVWPAVSVGLLLSPRSGIRLAGGRSRRDTAAEAEHPGRDDQREHERGGDPFGIRCPRDGEFAQFAVQYVLCWQGVLSAGKSQLRVTRLLASIPAMRDRRRPQQGLLWQPAPATDDVGRSRIRSQRRCCCVLRMK